MSFVPDSILRGLGSLGRGDADSADFGIVQVDNEGKILLYNKYESDMAGVSVTEAEGKNFFKEVAPCTNNRLFFGKFQKGISEGSLNESFDYTFTYKMKPTNVAIHMLHDKATSTNWVFVKKK